MIIDREEILSQTCNSTPCTHPPMGTWFVEPSQPKAHVFMRRKGKHEWMMHASHDDEMSFFFCPLSFLPLPSF